MTFDSLSLQDGDKLIADELFDVIRRHSKAMESDRQGIPGRLPSLGHRLVTDQLRMYNVTRSVIQKGNMILTRFLMGRDWIDKLNISISGHPNIVGAKSIRAFHFVTE
jgi:hypothetical protein